MNISAVCLIACLVIAVIDATALAECVEYKIVDHGDSVEAVCIGKPLTVEEQNIRLEEDKREQQRINNQMKLEQQQRRERAGEELRTQERKAQERKAQEQSNQDQMRNVSKKPSRIPPRQDKANQRTFGN